MPKGKQIVNTVPIGSIEDAVRNSEWSNARLRMAVKLARMMDNSDSARDIKSLSLSLEPLLDKCEADAVARGVEEGTPLADILAEAEAALIHG